MSNAIMSEICVMFRHTIQTSRRRSSLPNFVKTENQVLSANTAPYFFGDTFFANTPNIAISSV